MLNWGIIGLGRIAAKFTRDLALLEGHKLQAVASRDIKKAKSFANSFGAEKAYGDYGAILMDNEVDIIYIATPHHNHSGITIECLNAKKHVLCEKPIAINQGEVVKMVDASKQNEVFLMEAFWTRFNPSIKKILEIIGDGEIGEVRYLQADFCFLGDQPDSSRLYNMDLAGGALLDIGVYPLFLAYTIMGYPKDIIASSIFHRTGSDLQTAMIFQYAQGYASLMCGFNSFSQMQAKISGEKGEIIIHPRWHETEAFSLIIDQDTKRFSYPKLGKGYTYEIEECRACIEKGLTESPLWTHQNSLDLVSICDTIRDQIELVYPFES